MKKSTYLLLATLATLFSVHAHAEKLYTAVAFGSNGAYGWAADKTQKKANKTALILCNKGKSSPDCSLSTYVAAARVSNNNRVGVGYSIKNSNEAIQKAMKACGHSDCKLEWTITEPGFVVVAQKEQQDNDGDVYFQYGGTNLEYSVMDALANCKEHYKNKCSVTRAFSIPGAVIVKDTSPKPKTSTTQEISDRNCRPNTKNIRCSSQCSNGNCVVTYENGCKIHVQVTPTIDPFSGQMSFPTPQC